MTERPFPQNPLSFACLSPPDNTNGNCSEKGRTLLSGSPETINPHFFGIGQFDPGQNSPRETINLHFFGIPFPKNRQAPLFCSAVRRPIPIRLGRKARRAADRNALPLDDSPSPFPFPFHIL
ncbi:MAG: hypothetical protein BAA03_02935 [Caldibacillus debilis]|nr:MAG: hypothetical protein BAA03_02935 [Caldibacillus debilis]